MLTQFNSYLGITKKKDKTNKSKTLTELPISLLLECDLPLASRAFLTKTWPTNTEATAIKLIVSTKLVSELSVSSMSKILFTTKAHNAKLTGSDVAV